MDFSTMQAYSNPNYRASYSGPFAGGYGSAAPPSANTGFGFNLDTFNLGLQGLSTLGNFWNSFQAQKLAKQQFQFQKDFANTNLANQIKSYNTTLSDRARSRGVVEGQSADQVDQYIRDNQLSR